MQTDPKTLYAGYSRVVVTPPMGYDIPGYFSKRYSDGIIDDLHLRCTALSLGDVTGLVYCCDSLEMKQLYFDAVKVKIAERCNIDPENIYITCTHSHTSFRLSTAITEDELFNAHQQFMMEKFCECGYAALQDLKPCTMRTASGNAQDVAYCRLYRLKDGTCKTNPPIGSPDVVAPIGEQDTGIQLIHFVREDANDIMLMSFGTHADTVGGTKFCPDWPGYLMQAVERAFDDKVDAMILMGTQGNSNTRKVFNQKDIPTGVARAKRTGYVLAGEFIRIAEYTKEVPVDKLAFAHKYVIIEKSECEPEEIPIAYEVCNIYREKGRNAEELKQYSMSVPRAIRIKGNLERTEPFNLRVSGFRVGNVAAVGIPGEPFMSIGLDIKSRSCMDMTLVTASTNGHQGYFPDAISFKEKGYESDYSPFAHDCGQKLADTAIDVINEMNKA